MTSRVALLEELESVYPNALPLLWGPEVALQVGPKGPIVFFEGFDEDWSPRPSG